MLKTSLRTRTPTVGVALVAVLACMISVSCTSKEERSWEAAKTENSVAAYEGFLSQFPETEFAPEAQERVLDLLPVIVFTSEREGGFGVFTMRYDGSQVTRVSPEDEKASGAMMSPDGKRIAYTSDRDGDGEIYVMNVDGTGVVQLTDNQDLDSSPAWSPDGRKIAFMSERNKNTDIYVMNADGTDPVRLTDHPGADIYPAWSPDGSRIAFTSHREGNQKFFTVSTAVEDFATSSGLFGLRPLSGDIYVMNVDGSGMEALVTDPANDAHPVWSPDGQRIIFTSQRNGDEEIYAINVDGSGITRLTHQQGFARRPICYPAHGEIIFTSNQGDAVNVWMVEADGSNPRQLTEDPANDMVG
jgi:Tol biopolymer transport system component